MDQDPIQEIDREALAEELQRQHAAIVDDGGDGIDAYIQWAERLFTSPWHRKLFVVWVIFLLWVSMNFRYNYANKTKEVSTLEDQVKDLEYRRLFITAELVRLERISNIEEQVKELGLNLEHSSQPPYIITPKQKED